MCRCYSFDGGSTHLWLVSSSSTICAATIPLVSNNNIHTARVAHITNYDLKVIKNICFFFSFTILRVFKNTEIIFNKYLNYHIKYREEKIIE